MTDIDDGLAVGMALADRALDVRGVVVTFGNNDIEGAIVQIVACPSPPDYNDPDNPCVDHGPGQKVSLDKESSQLWLSSGGTSRLQMCTAYASEQAMADFLRAIFEFVR